MYVHNGSWRQIKNFEAIYSCHGKGLAATAIIDIHIFTSTHLGHLNPLDCMPHRQLAECTRNSS